MKIAFLIGQLNGGGAERVVANLANAFCNNGHETVMITFNSSEKEYSIQPQITRYVINDSKTGSKNPFRFFVRANRVRSIVKKHNFDFVVAFMGSALYYCIWGTCALRTKSIISVRNDPNFLYNTFLKRLFAKCILPLTDGVVFQTEDAMKWFPRRMAKKGIIIFNPVAKGFYDTIYTPLENLVMTCGRLNDQKNHKLLVNAFSKVIKEIPEAKLEIYGDGPNRQELIQLVSNLNLENNVFLKGRVEDIAGKLNKASLFVLSSNVEGSPNALMEAMAIGVPCISTDCPCGGPRLLLENGKNGILIPTNDENSLSKSIIALLKERDKCIAFSEKAKLRALQFKQEVVYQAWIDYMEKLSNTTNIAVNREGEK